jgi:23S rRNA (uracil1939-C5)-methyltransferase
MALKEQAECVILSLNKKGLGVGETQNGLVEVPYVLPGEIIEFERHIYRGSNNCRVRSIKVCSQDRAEPKCQYFGVCGGCLLQHLTEKDYVKFKTDLLKDLPSHTLIHPLITIPFASRRRANIEAVKKNDKLFLGFHRFHSNQIVNIDKCPALSPKLSDILPGLKEVLAEILIDRQKAHLFLTEAYNGVDILLSISDLQSLGSNQRDSLIKFAEKNQILRLIFRYRKRADILVETAKPYVLFDSVPVEIDAQGFLQSSALSDQILKDKVMYYFAREDSNLRLVDLFCGRGTFSIPLARRFQTEGFESDKNALQALSDSLRIYSNPYGFNLSVNSRDLFENPLTIKELNNYDLCVINPPRAGAVSQSIHLKDSKIRIICYVSCNPESFLRDSIILESGGYKLSEVTPVDQFYGSPHLEIVASFIHKDVANTSL